VVSPGFAVVDVETTGFSSSTERIVEIAVVVVEPDGTVSESFCTLLDPDRHPGPTHVHGITSEMVNGAPTFESIHPHLASLLSGRVVVGHNVDRFDLGFLRAECQRCGGDSLVPDSVVMLDTLVVARDLLGLYGRASLSDCCDRFGLSWDDHHSALGDAAVTADLLQAMRNELGDEALGITDLLNRATLTLWPVGDVAASDPVHSTGTIVRNRSDMASGLSAAEPDPAPPVVRAYTSVEQPVLHQVLVAGTPASVA